MPNSATLASIPSQTQMFLCPTWGKTHLDSPSPIVLNRPAVYPRCGQRRPATGRPPSTPPSPDGRAWCSGQSPAHTHSSCPLPLAGSPPTLTWEFSCCSQDLCKHIPLSHRPLSASQAQTLQFLTEPESSPARAAHLQTGTRRPRGAERVIHVLTAPRGTGRPRTALLDSVLSASHSWVTSAPFYTQVYQCGPHRAYGHSVMSIEACQVLSKMESKELWGTWRGWGVNSELAGELGTRKAFL